MTEEKWYHGRLSRLKAEELVNKAGIDGSFVVRASESILGAYALSVLYSGTIHTYRILPTESGLLAVQTINGVQQRKFTSISELIFAYRSPQNGLVCGLTNPVGTSPDKPTMAPPPAMAAAIPVHDIARSLPMHQTLPHPANTPPLIPRSGIRVMMDDRKPSQKPKQDRELPPLPPPARDAPQRPLIVPAASTSHDASTAGEIKAKLQDRVKNIVNVCPSVGISFLDSLQQYCADGVQRDLADILQGNRQCAEMQKLLAKEAVQFQKELELFLQKIDVLRQLFDVQSAVRPVSNYDMRAERDVDLESFLTRLADCKNAVKSLNKRTSINIKEQAGMEVESMYGTALRPSGSASSNGIPEYNFEVKFEGGLKLSRQKLRVKVDQGRLQILKGDGMMDFAYDQVLQIIKNNKCRSKLALVIDGGKKREYAFESSQQREAFCQVMQLVRNMHSKNTEPDCVSLFIGSWNMGDAMPPPDIGSWFRCGGSGRTLDPTVCEIPHDVYVIGTQETGLPEKEWLKMVIETVSSVTGVNLHLVAMDALWHIKIIILVKEEHKNRISHVQTSSVKTGIANTLGNKGAVAVSFQFGGTSLCFINAHLTSGNEKCGRRNQNYHDIMRALNLGHDRCSMFDLTNRFDHLFFLGDLNYRLEMEVQEILTHIKKRDLNMLYKVDQLRRERELNKVFYRFSEEEILFPPTYRYERGNREVYSHLKIKRTGIRINVPSWCDRVLWKSYPETHSVCMAYGCCDDVMTSDHSPVFCNIQVGVRGQYVSNEGLKSGSRSSDQPATILFESIEAILKASGKTGFYLQFQSTCLASSVKTTRSMKCDTTEHGPNCIRVTWDRDSIPELSPIISDREYLVDQHLLVLVKGEDDNDNHAEFVLALRSMIGTSPQRFQEHLTRKGEDAGQIQGSMHVKTRDTTVVRKEKTYDFIQIGKREEVQETPIYSETNEIARQWNFQNAPQSKLQSVTPNVSSAISKMASVTSKIGNIVPKMTNTPKTQVWTRTDTRPPIPAPTATYQGASLGGIQNQPQLYSEAEVVQRPRTPSSDTSSPKKNRETSPVFPARFPHNHRDTPTFDLEPVIGSPGRSRPIPASTSTTSLDAMIAEFEATGSMFEGLSLMEEERRQDQLPRQHTPPMRQNYDMVRQNYDMDGMQAQMDTRRPMPAPSAPAPRLLATVPPLIGQPRYPIGQAVASINHSRSVIGKVQGPSLPPPPGPAPQLPDRRRSVRVPGTSGSVMTVPDMMMRMGLSQYTTSLLDYGWDTLEFLSDVRDEDLMDCGIVNNEHRRAIIECVQRMEYAD